MSVRIYVLLRAMLPENVNLEAVLAMNEEQLRAEVERQNAYAVSEFGEATDFVAVYDESEFEDVINLCDAHEASLNPSYYYIRIFQS